MKGILVLVLVLVLLAGSASALEVVSDTSKFSATTVSYGGSTFTLWQGYFTITVTNGGAAVAGMEVRGAALGEQVTSIETTNSSGKVVLPFMTDFQPAIIRIQIRPCTSCPWEDNPNNPVDPGPGPLALVPSAAPAPPGGEAPPRAAPAAGPPAVSPSTPAALAPLSAGGLAPGGLFNAFPRSADWFPPGAPAVAAPAAEAAAAGGMSLSQAVLLDALMIGGSLGFALFTRVRPGRAR